MAGGSAYTGRMQITLLTVGRCRQPGFQELAAKYARRVVRYATLAQTEIREQRAVRGMPVEEVVRREGERILRAIPKGAYLIALDPAGQPCTSDLFAARISELGLRGRSRLAFAVGGAFGLAPEVVECSDWRLSLSALTFPHELARLVLLEQIYRAFTILRGENYHK